MQVVYLHPRRVDEVTDADVQPLCAALADNWTASVGDCTLQTLFAYIDTDNSGTFSSADVGAPLAHAAAEANTCPRHHGAMVLRAGSPREGRLVDCIPGYVGSAAHCWSHTMREAWDVGGTGGPAMPLDDDTVVPGDCDGHPHPVVDQYGCWEHIPGDCDNVEVNWDDGRQKQLWRDRGMSPTVDEDGDGSVSLTEFARWLSSYRVRSKPSLSFGGTIDTGAHAIIGGGSDGTGALTLVGRTNITMETLKCAALPIPNHQLLCGPPRPHLTKRLPVLLFRDPWLVASPSLSALCGSVSGGNDWNSSEPCASRTARLLLLNPL